MRLWSIHPKYLDRIGLAALWRESLLAQKILKGETKGYKHHPQLFRFRSHPDPPGAIAMYLKDICEESKRRGYNFDAGKIGTFKVTEKIPVTRGQLKYEFEWLSCKLKNRSHKKYLGLLCSGEIECHPLFEVIDGEVEDWEKKKLK